MKIAIVHYHLDTGGVSRVIESTSHILHASGVSHVILTGKLSHDADSPSRSVAPPLPVHEVPGLGYTPLPDGNTAERFLENLVGIATRALSGPPDIWHFHNHSLGKNRLLPEVINRLALSGARVILQIHDLAEEGRPANYPLVALYPHIYPVSPRIHYAFLNSRDLALFTAAGLPPGNASLLPNPVFPAPLPPVSPGSPPLLFAPVRGIRRKNLGELAFLSALAPAGTRVAVSRAPRNAAASAIHDTWVRFAARHQLPIAFDVVDRYCPAPGHPSHFDSWLAHATHFVTTSVSEGFGLPFLESIALGKPLLGRSLPHLIADQSRHGVRFPHLYDQILVPLSWVDLPLLRDHLLTAMERTWRDYGVSIPPDALEVALSALVRDRLLDFGNLPEALQQGVIERLVHPLERSIPLVKTGDSVRSLEAWLEEVLRTRGPAAPPESLAPWSIEAYRSGLIQIYQKVCGPVQDSPQGHIPSGRILSKTLSPATFSFLLSSPPPQAAERKFKAVVFDIYGTLLSGPTGGVKPDPLADPILRDVLRHFGHTPSASPSTDLHAAVLRHHAASDEVHPEIDLRVLWREILSLPLGTDTTALVQATEEAWHPARPTSGAFAFVRKLSRTGRALGLLSNAQCNTLTSLEEVSELFPPELAILSYQHGAAKPSSRLFQTLVDRLAARGIKPADTLYVGNDPLQDIAPASALGFATALYTGHPDSLRPGVCEPDITFHSWRDLDRWLEAPATPSTDGQRNGPEGNQPPPGPTRSPSRGIT